jgi:hypothetical protein
MGIINIDYKSIKYGQESRTHNTGLAKVAVQCSADTLAVNQALVPRINTCGESRHLRQARKRYNCERKHQSLDYQTPEKLFKKIV